jgi:hypothetical protein
MYWLSVLQMKFASALAISFYHSKEKEEEEETDRPCVREVGNHRNRNRGEMK